MRGTSARDFQGISPVLSAPKGRDMSAQGKCGGVSRQTPPWGSLLISGEALKGRHKPLLTRDYCHGHARAVSPFQGFRSMPPDTQGGALACPGLICRAPSGLKTGQGPTQREHSGVLSASSAVSYSCVPGSNGITIVRSWSRSPPYRRFSGSNGITLCSPRPLCLPLPRWPPSSFASLRGPVNLASR